MPSWYALHVLPTSEAIVSRKLAEANIESYYPFRMEKSTRKYRPDIEKRFFPGYVFAHFELSDRTPVIAVSQVIQILGTAHSPAPIPDHELAAIRLMVQSASASLTTAPLVVGEAVLIERGPLQGLTGTVIRSKGKAHVVVSIGAIGRSLMAEIDIQDCAVNSSGAH